MTCINRIALVAQHIAPYYVLEMRPQAFAIRTEPRMEHDYKRRGARSRGCIEALGIGHSRGSYGRGRLSRCRTRGHAPRLSADRQRTWRRRARHRRETGIARHFAFAVSDQQGEIMLGLERQAAFVTGAGAASAGRPVSRWRLEAPLSG